MSQAKVRTHMDRTNIEDRKKNARKKRIVIHGCEGGVKRNHADGIDARRSEQAKAICDERQFRRGSCGHHDIGIGIEGHRDSGNPASMCVDNHLVNKMTMPAMYAIKRTDSDRTCATRKSGSVLEGIDRCRSFTEQEVAP